MASLSEMPAMARVGVVVAVVAALSLAAWYFIYRDMSTANTTALTELKAKQAENDRLRAYEPRLRDMQTQIETYKAQLIEMKKIVPDEKLADQFMRLMQQTAGQAGIEIRRYTAKQSSTREFYTEAPYEMELDGPYYSMRNFFDRVAKLERIINVADLKVATLTHSGDAGAKHSYAYAPGESVVATCQTTTFFSKDNFVPAAPAK